MKDLFRPILRSQAQATLLRILVMFLLAECGFALGRAFPKPQYVISSASLFELNKDATWNHLALAISTLANCQDFKQNNRVRYAKFQRQIRGNQRIGYDAALSPDFYAFTDIVTRTIWLGPAYFAQEPAEQVRTLAHEMLHLSDFPNHTKRALREFNFTEDLLYKQTDACFPKLPKEAL